MSNDVVYLRREPSGTGVKLLGMRVLITQNIGAFKLK